MSLAGSGLSNIPIQPCEIVTQLLIPKFYKTNHHGKFPSGIRIEESNF